MPRADRRLHRWNGLLLPSGIIVPTVKRPLEGQAKEESRWSNTTIAVDLAKSGFQMAVSHRAGHVDDERRLSRDRFLKVFAHTPPATIVLEACGSAHYWARQRQPFGHSVRLLPPHDVRPYVRRNKTDRTDAKGLLEANRNRRFTRCLTAVTRWDPLPERSHSRSLNHRRSRGSRKR